MVQHLMITIMANRELRMSEYGDYVAVDIVEHGVVKSTPFFLSRNGSVKAIAFDQESKKWIECQISFSSGKLIATDIDDFSWDIEPNDLLDKDQFRFL